MTDSPPDEEMSPPPFVRNHSVSPYGYEDPSSPALGAEFDTGGPAGGRAPNQMSAWSGLRPPQESQPQPGEGGPRGLLRAGEHSRARLLAEHANVEEKRRKLEEDLFAATRAGRPAAVKAVLDEGAPADARDGNGWTPLCWAAADGRNDVVPLLLKARAHARAMTPYLPV